MDRAPARESAKYLWQESHHTVTPPHFCQKSQNFFLYSRVFNSPIQLITPSFTKLQP